jgi:amidase
MLAIALACLAFIFAAASSLAAQQPAAPAPPPFRIEETTIADVHAAMRAGALTCRALVSQYLARIEAYDKNGPGINAVVIVNPDALAIADSLDRRFRETGRLTGPLHCVPAIVKDNFETVGLQTTAGSLSLKGFVSHKDAFQVRRIKDAGAIVLAKSNMAEYAFSPYETVSSILPGYTKNPYALDRVTAGSSGGTAAAVASNFGLVGLGTDTGNSIRGPSAHNALVGIRSTMGLTSRGGVVPLNLSADIAGPMARTVADAVAVFQVIAGTDRDDPATNAAQGRTIPNYAAGLARVGLVRTRIGVLRQAYERPTTDPEVVDVFRHALDDLRQAGATVVDSAVVPELDSLLRIQQGGCNPFKYDLNRWLLGHRGHVPIDSLADVLRTGRYHPSIQKRLEVAQAVEQAPEDAPGCKSRDQFREQLRQAVLRMMDRLRLDALVYPTWSNPPRLIGDLNTPHGDNNQLFSPSTGFPAVTVPMGYTRGALPAGLQFFGRPWTEGTLLKLAFAYEQATHHRHPPPSVPPLRTN